MKAKHKLMGDLVQFFDTVGCTIQEFIKEINESFSEKEKEKNPTLNYHDKFMDEGITKVAVKDGEGTGIPVTENDVVIKIDAQFAVVSKAEFMDLFEPDLSDFADENNKKPEADASTLVDPVETEKEKKDANPAANTNTSPEATNTNTVVNVNETEKEKTDNSPEQL